MPAWFFIMGIFILVIGIGLVVGISKTDPGWFWLPPQYPLAYIPVDNPLPAKIKFIHAQYILWVIITYPKQGFKFPLYGFSWGQQIGNLNIDALPMFFAYKINFPVTGLTDSNRVVSAAQYNLRLPLQYTAFFPNF
jgi:hypothetical protein